MKEEQHIGVAIPNNVISQTPIADTIVVDVYDVYCKKLIERVVPVNSVPRLAHILKKNRDPGKITLKYEISMGDFNLILFINKMQIVQQY